MILHDVHCSACHAVIPGLRRKSSDPRIESFCGECAAVRAAHPDVFAWVLRVLSDRVEPLVRETMDEHTDVYRHECRGND